MEENEILAMDYFAVLSREYGLCFYLLTSGPSNFHLKMLSFHLSKLKLSYFFRNSIIYTNKQTNKQTNNKHIHITREYI